MSRDGLSFGSSCRTLRIASNPLSKLATHNYKKKSLDILLSVSEEAYLMKGMIIKKLFALFPRACLEVRSFLWRGRSSMRNH